MVAESEGVGETVADGANGGGGATEEGEGELAAGL